VNNYITFRPASLGLCDIEDGDFNAICLGMDKIDPRCFKGMTVGLELRLKALLGNPTIFYKQRDFGYHVKDIQQIQIKNKVIYFNHTDQPKKRDCISLRNYDSAKKHAYQIYCSSLPKYSFISYNVKDMDAILSLNFFRFIDTLQGHMADEEIEKIYKEIEGLNEPELIAFLTEIGRKISCSAEFNFTGAYKIDLDALKSVSYYSEREKKYSVEMDSLYSELSEKKTRILKEFMKNIPGIFKSERFRNHLLSKTPESGITESPQMIGNKENIL
jgi:hypothetical protein